jgi:hypothetical protein
LAPRLELKAHWVSFRASLGVENIGRSPAPRATARISILPGLGSENEAGEAERLCRDAVALRIPWRETLIFPNEGRGLAIDADIHIESIAAYNRTLIERDFEFFRSVARDEEAALERRALLLSARLRAAFTIVGCVSYEIPISRSFGQTGFVYRVSKECGREPHVFCTFEVDEPAIYEGDALALRRDSDVDFAR